MITMRLGIELRHIRCPITVSLGGGRRLGAGISLKWGSANFELRESLKANMNNFLRDGKGMLLAYDQGFEHGPSADFNDKNIDPSYILDIAAKGDFTGLVLHKGIAEKYYTGKIPLIVKLNGKTR